MSLTPGTCSPVRIQFLISTVLAYGKFGGWTSICDFRVLLLAEFILCFISCLHHTKIQHFVDFQPPTSGFTRVMTPYFSADVFLFTPFIFESFRAQEKLLLLAKQTSTRAATLEQVWNVSNNNQLYTFNIYINIYKICLTSTKLKYRNQTKFIKTIG